MADGHSIHSYTRENHVFLLANDLSESMDDFWVELDPQGNHLTVEYNTELLELPLVEFEPDCDLDNAIMFPDSGTILIPLQKVLDIPGLNSLEDTERNVLYLSKGLDHSRIPTGVKVPILMYHCVSDDLYGIASLHTSPKDFREEMEYLLEQGYSPIFFSDLSHVQDYEKPIIITLDDGYLDNYDEMFPIIAEYGIPVTIFMITDYSGHERHLTEDMMWEMSNSGLVSIQSHTTNHIALPENDAETQEDTMYRSKLAVARLCGRVPYVLSYPYGQFDETTKELAEKYYDLAVRTNHSIWYTDGSYYDVSRLSMSRELTLSQFAALLEQ